VVGNVFDSAENGVHLIGMDSRIDGERNRAEIILKILINPD